jgi:hypothetical protein
LEPIGESAALQLVQARQFFLGGGDDHLTANFIRDAILIAKCHQFFAAGDARARFQ